MEERCRGRGGRGRTPQRETQGREGSEVETYGAKDQEDSGAVWR